MSVEHEAGLNEDLKHCRLNLIPTRGATGDEKVCVVSRSFASNHILELIKPPQGVKIKQQVIRANRNLAERSTTLAPKTEPQRNRRHNKTMWVSQRKATRAGTRNWRFTFTPPLKL